MSTHEVYRFETDTGRGAFAVGRARVRYKPSGDPVHNPGAWGDRMYGSTDPEQTLYTVGQTNALYDYRFGFFDLTQARHWFGEQRIIEDMYEEEPASYWRLEPTPLRVYTLDTRHIFRAHHQVTFHHRRAVSMRTLTLTEALSLLCRDQPPVHRCTLCPTDSPYEG